MTAQLRSGMVLHNNTADQARRGLREIVIASVYPGPAVAVVQDMRTGGRWRASLATLRDRWTYTGTDAWTES